MDGKRKTGYTEMETALTRIWGRLEMTGERHSHEKIGESGESGGGLEVKVFA